MAAGTIGTVIDTFTFDADAGSDPNILFISSDVYAIAYRGVDGHGWLKTVNIFAEGGINSTVIDSLEFEAASCQGPQIRHVSGDIYAIVFQDADTDGKVVTVDIDSTGAIEDSIVDSGEWATYCDQDPDFIKIYGTIFAAATVDSANDGFLYTFSIAANGTVGAAIDNIEFEAAGNVSPIHCHIIHIVGTMYAISYQRSAGASLCTVEIDSSGNITDAVIDTLDIGVTMKANSIAKVSGDIYAVAYGGTDNDGFIFTVAIYTSGQIGDAVIDTLEFDEADCYTPYLLLTSFGIMAVAYRGTSNHGFLKTMDISVTGAIGAVIDTLEFDTVSAGSPELISIPDADNYTIVYTRSVRGEIATTGVSPEKQSGSLWVEGDYLHYFDESGIERKILGVTITSDEEILAILGM